MKTFEGGQIPTQPTAQPMPKVKPPKKDEPDTIHQLTTGDIASAIAMWAKANGYIGLAVGTNQINDKEIIVEASASK